MPSFSMAELIKSQSGKRDVVQQSQQFETREEYTTVGRRVKRSVPETKQLIKNFIFKQRRACLILEICDHLKRKPTPHIRSILNEMVRDGELTTHSDIAPGAVMPRFWYALP